jgi:putative restriction endonuclease
MQSRINELQMRLLQEQYSDPDRSVTAPELAKLANVSGYPIVNLNYGRLGSFFCEATGLEAGKDKEGIVRWWTVWSIGYSTHKGFLWEMHSEVAEALEILGWVTGDNPVLRIFPDEVNEAEVFREGSVCKVSVNAYERSPQARQKCIDYYGVNCFVCGFSFGEVFGKLGDSFIHVHHLCPISEIAEEYEVDPVRDLRPVCPNCHAMIHRRSPPLSIEEMMVLLKTNHYDSAT